MGTMEFFAIFGSAMLAGMSFTLLQIRKSLENIEKHLERIVEREDA